MSLIQMRPAGPNEHRCIIRQAVDYYRWLVVGGLYTAEKPEDLRSQLIKALKYCISKHPILSAAILDSEKQHPRFAKPSHFDLNNHIAISPPLQRTRDRASSPSTTKDGEQKEVDWREDAKPLLISALDAPLENVDSIPPWRVHAQQLPPVTGETAQRFVLLFAYGHSHGDGMSGLTFLRTLLQGLNAASASASASSGSGSGGDGSSHDDSVRFATTSHALPAPLEVAGKLSISPSYLLSPMLGDRLPRFLAAPLGLRATAIPEAPGSWRGNSTYFHSSGPAHTTGVEIVAVPHSVVSAVLRQCRRYRNRRRGSQGGGVRMTGLLHQLIVRALTDLLPADGGGRHASVSIARSFVAQSAVDLRRSVPGLRPDEMGIAVTGFYEAFPRADADDWSHWLDHDDDGNNDDEDGNGNPVWRAMEITTDGLARQASTLHNQPVGLLKYLNDFRGWTLAHLGKPREASYEISNLTVFDPRGPLRQQGASNEDKEKKGKEIEEEEDDDEKNDDKWRIAGLVFSQPANVTGGCFDVNVVTLCGGDLTLAASWQRGALGVADEDAFMRELVDKVAAWLRELANAG